MDHVVKRKVPFGDNKRLEHAKRSGGLSYPHDMLIVWVPLKAGIPVKQVVDKALGDIAKCIMAEFFQKVFHMATICLYSEKLANHIKPLSRNQKDYKQHVDLVWTRLLYGLEHPNITYSDRLTYGLLDEDITRIIHKFFPRDHHLPEESLWDARLTRFARGNWSLNWSTYHCISQEPRQMSTMRQEHTINPLFDILCNQWLLNSAHMYVKIYKFMSGLSILFILYIFCVCV